MKKRCLAVLTTLCLMLNVVNFTTVQAFENGEDGNQKDVQKEEQFYGETRTDESNIAVMDKMGNVDFEDMSQDNTVVEEDNVSRISEPQIVNLRKQSGVLEYTEVETGTPGYTSGAYGADAAYLGMSGNNVKFMIGGVIGVVPKDKVQVINKSSAKSVSYYAVSEGKLYHYISTNVNGTMYASTLDNGPAPSYLKSGIKYYSYDGHYFYIEANFSNMLSDYNRGTRTYSVNINSPFYNYFQYLPLRSRSNYSEDTFNNIINSRVSSSSKMKNTGKDFVNYQNTYGVNALLAAGLAGNESAWGTSNICMTKNNLFGLNAVDSSPNQSADYFSSINQCIKEFTERWMSKEYLNPSSWKYFGGFLGNKASGINVKYASDPYWGEKAAAGVWKLDAAGGNRDAEKYTIGIKDTINPENKVNVRKDANTSYPALYLTPKQGSVSFLILDKNPINKFYRIQSDGVLNSGRTAIDKTTGKYNFEQMYAYISSDYIQIISEGKGNTDTWQVEDIKFNLPSPQMLNSNIVLTTETSGHSLGLEYKYVWQKNNWSEWGTLRGFSKEKSINWKPTSGGIYTLIVDVKDSKGKIISFSKEYEIKDWTFSKMITDVQSPQYLDTTINVQTICEGNTSQLQYKYVWEKDNWSEWGTLRGFSKEKNVQWKPQKTGNYNIYVDIMDSSGYILKATLPYKIEEKEWEFVGIQMNQTSPVEVGDSVIITPQIKNENSNLLYKYVWERNNWSEWGVLQEPSKTKTIKWIASKPGNYKIHVDVIDAVTGKVSKKYVEIKVNTQKWNISEIQTSVKSPQKLGKTIEITTEITGNRSGLQYKYVWEKDNWSEWGTLRNFSTDASVDWKPDKVGNYKIHVDVLDSSGRIEKVSLEYRIDEKWEFVKIQTDKTMPIEVGEVVNITPQINGDDQELLYKYVWEKDDWSEWGVLQGPSKTKTIKWTASKPGNYKIHVDVIDAVTGKVSKKYVEIKVSTQKWNISEIQTSVKSPQKLGKTIKITTEIAGNKSGLQYKYVWEKDNWSEWGTLRNFSTDASVDWKPDKVGNYRIHVDVLDSAGKIIKKDLVYAIK